LFYVRIARHLGERFAFARLGAVLVGLALRHWMILVPSGVRSHAGVHK
jgi:hypothetical protein